MKNFDEWTNKKKSIEKRKPLTYAHEREIWWCSIGINIGSEEDGKNDLFERPVLVIKRFGESVVLVVPFTTQIKEGIYEYQFIKGGNVWVVLLSQLRLVSTKRFSRKIRKINEALFEEIKWQIIKVNF
jgi:mRNA-degrading endonuclease toxin of MazEF toxin-antitoxin module